MDTRYSPNDLKAPKSMIEQALMRVIEHQLTGPWHSGTGKIQVLSFNLQTSKAHVKFVDNPEAVGTGFEQEHHDWLNCTWYVPIQQVLNTRFS